MSNMTTLLDRNRRFAEHFDAGDLPIRAQLSMIVVTCLDARLDPARFLGLELGDAFVMRNAGGRITPAVLQDLAVLGALAASVAGPGAVPPELVLIQHTDCGMARLADPAVQQDAARRLGIDVGEVAAMAITDPAANVRGEIERLRGSAGTPDQMVVSGYVYDVATGSVDEIVPPAPVRAPG